MHYSSLCWLCAHAREPKHLLALLYIVGNLGVESVLGGHNRRYTQFVYSTEFLFIYFDLTEYYLDPFLQMINDIK